ncbi:sn-glycerol-3-phosphate ABC transporter ATP-binding protein UgpC (plasmid) [Agrobacterium tumefaciens]|uniref:Sn-glycerol-3-phosphate ABC transporter ATP-binding protein UgpC n=1 Tax=Agrobacterium tumefaciens TaxID=358 RepID=A0AAP9J9N1_AGRTU|nr:sn-glycerol-3-phosphate ABC transporter ATP-binding protein UgpC [Agrobacterium tumefaciens]NSZ61181.1 sn-glycerol-3-phosphate ABC transporter ATP-binding protein UgpC [Agrobacterium tumefaciens]QDY97591.1 sn-glycerol-3-phosphate ABC transporter ATP-binding protein UgpC [Agrobacterium tumefaciens]UXS12718.1 sn-glycerol-3-phosphate ABC transporter ATP-binding protein UgpC [Agrobacterium tumefaciens]UXS20080.1 sn-glycerol-3-phosphate ABC transporter ATP-binding protein UgpC [Agrobacterium tume
MAKVTIRKLEKSYGDYQAVKGIDLAINDNEFVVLVGPSGCGKSTTLRMVAGLEDISGGDISIDGRRVNDIAPGRRDIAMVFQNYALYPHMTVRDNMAFGLKQRGTAKTEIEKRIVEVARILEITPLLDRKPRMLSGGQRQRVAMGRAIVRNPKVFLFDEPLSNLDAKLRVQMRTEIKKLHQALPTTTIYVTHDQVEAMTMADRVVVMNGGIIEQVGPPQELYRRPVSRFVAGFIGSPAMNFLPVTLQKEGDDMLLRLETGATVRVPDERKAAYAPHIGRSMVFGIRPEAFGLGLNRPDVASVEVAVDVVEPLGAETLAYVKLASSSLCVRLDPADVLTPGTPLHLQVDMNQMYLIDPATDLVIY